MNNPFCQYKDIFGKPNTGTHSYRILNIAIIDVFITLLLAFVISYFSNQQNVLYIFFILVLMSIFIHKLFCVDTTLTKLVFNK